MDFLKGTNVLESNDDLLREIMLRLPSNSIFKFTCVSTRWSDVITDPCFSKLYIERTRRSLGCSYPRGRLLGFLQDIMKNIWSLPDRVAHTFLLVRSDDYLETNMGKKIGACPGDCDYYTCGAEFIPYEPGYFMTFSKDGLFISASIHNKYYVGDPITGKGETFPTATYRSYGQRALSIGLLSDDKDGVINFRVVIVTGYAYKTKASKMILIDTYSSRTKEWRRWRFISEIPFAIESPAPPTLSGGFLHWFTIGVGRAVAFDSSLLDGDAGKKKHVLQVIKVPYNKGSKIIWRSDNGQTMWFGTSNWQDGVEVYRKRDDSDDWALVSRVGNMNTMRRDVIGRSPKDLRMEYFVITRAKLRNDKSFKWDYEMVWMEAFVPWNPRLVVMRLGEKFFMYDCVKQIVDDEIMFDGCCRTAAYRWEWFPYFHSLSNAKYKPELPSH